MPRTLAMLLVLAMTTAASVQAQEPDGTSCAGKLTPSSGAATLIACLQAVEKEIAVSPRSDVRAALPVGTIIASYLGPTEFAGAIGETVGDALANRTWVLADGSEVVGTSFARTTNGKRLPDLRGMFLRGVDGQRAAGEVQQYSTALPDTPFTGDAAESGASALSRPAVAVTNGDLYSAGGDPFPVIVISKEAQSIPAHTHSVTVHGGGDAETRPVNVGVYYYIKVN